MINPLFQIQGSLGSIHAKDITGIVRTVVILFFQWYQKPSRGRALYPAPLLLTPVTGFIPVGWDCYFFNNHPYWYKVHERAEEPTCIQCLISHRVFLIIALFAEMGKSVERICRITKMATAFAIAISLIQFTEQRPAILPRWRHL